MTAQPWAHETSRDLSATWPAGLIYREDFITAAAEQQLLPETRGLLASTLASFLGP